MLCSVEDQTELPIAGTLLRQLGSEDQLIVKRLEKFRDRASKRARKKSLSEIWVRSWWTWNICLTASRYIFISSVKFLPNLNR